MTETLPPALVLLIPALPVCAWAAWSDLRSMTIPNLAVLALLGGFAALGPTVMPLPEYGARWLQALAVLVMGAAMAATGGLGAGDAKFAAAMAAYVAPGDVVLFLYLLSLVVIAVFALHRGLRVMPMVRAAAPGWESWERAEFPLGLALGPALALYLALAAAMG